MPFGFHLAVDTLPSGNRKRWLQVRLGCVQLSPSCPFRLLHTFLSPGPRGITPAFGYGAPHPSARGTSTLLNNALLSAHYDDPSDSNSEWIHSTARAAWTGTPQTGGPFAIPAVGASAFQVTSDLPSGDYDIKAYFSKAGANQPVGAFGETDFSVATSTSPGGCFIATAAFGSPMARQVQWLRASRDRVLLPGRAGRAFVNWYYGWSPRAAAWLHVHSVARKLTRVVLWIPVAFSWSSLRTDVVCASLGFLLLLLSLGWSLRRGPAWWKGLCLLILAIGIVSAQIPPANPRLLLDRHQASPKPAIVDRVLKAASGMSGTRAAPSAAKCPRTRRQKQKEPDRKNALT